MTAQSAAAPPDHPLSEHPLRRSLSALGHPLTLASVALLLLNDHVFKEVAPSALTGKLSDMAGMFFAPYLLAALLGIAGAGLRRLPLGRRGARLRSLPPGRRGAGLSPLPQGRRRAGPGGNPARPWEAWGAYLFTAALFAAIKLHPEFNAGVNAALRSAFGLPVQVALDPTDLIALLALAPSAWLWSQVGIASGRPPLRRSLAAVGLASLAALATSPCPPEQPITHLVPFEGKLYALATAWQPVSGVNVATGEGRLWDSLNPETAPAALLEAAATPVSLPKTACAEGMEQVCYRAAGQELVEVSEDGGQTWRIVWRMPESRRGYMERVASGYGQILACGKTLDLRATDVAVLGSGASHIAIVALGNEGVLRGRYGLAEWERVSVGLAEPTPENGGLAALFPPMIILGETGFALAAGAAAFVLLSVLSWSRLETGVEAPQAEGGSRSPWIIGAVLVSVLVVLMSLADVEELIPSVLPPLVGLSALIVAMIVRWRRATRRAARPAEAHNALRVSGAAGVLTALGLWLPFALWVVGIIPWYSAALWLAVGAAVALVVWNLGRLPRGSRPAPKPDQPVS